MMLRSSGAPTVITATRFLCFVLATVIVVGGACLMPPVGAHAEAELPASPSGAKQIHPPKEAPINVPYLSWLPGKRKARVAMLCIHGFSLHKGCFEAFGQAMAKEGIAVYAMDLRGFGELKDKGDNTELDFDGCLADIKGMLELIHKRHPDLPVIILGESMGGAVALRATALYPDLLSGLIAAVPARDRFGMTGKEKVVGLRAVLRTLFGGFTRPIKDVAMSAVEKISKKEEVRSEWKSDPLMRTSFSPKEFVQLDRFMADNLEVASMVKQTPVLFIQGTNDKLIRPAGTWKLYERLATPRRQMVLSKNSEHLIFEEAQFRADDLTFVLAWITRNVSPLDADIAQSTESLRVVASQEEYSDDAAPPVMASNGPLKINFWIELARDGKRYRCNNKTAFKSGDGIRFHLIPECDGYAYLVMQEGTTGKSEVLFPSIDNGTENFMKKGQDYPIPSVGWMQFDQNPGTEQLGLVFARSEVDVTPESLRSRTLTCLAKPEQSGAKSLRADGVMLSWENTAPIRIAHDFSGLSQLDNSTASSLVRLGSTDDGSMVAAKIHLLHGQ